MGERPLDKNFLSFYTEIIRVEALVFSPGSLKNARGAFDPPALVGRAHCFVCRSRQEINNIIKRLCAHSQGVVYEEVVVRPGCLPVRFGFRVWARDVYHPRGKGGKKKEGPPTLLKVEGQIIRPFTRMLQGRYIALQ
jgi:hypothetical protein